MAVIDVNFFSKSLMRQTTFKAIIPCDKMFFDGKIHEVRPFKTLYLLHGVFGDHTDWVNGTRIVRWAQDRDLAVIMPSAENKFYTNQSNPADQMGDYIEELVTFTRDLFHLSDRREDTFIAGLSMGGYGALIHGLRHADLFSHIGALSAALNKEEIIHAPMVNSAFPICIEPFFASIFGDLDCFIGSEHDFDQAAIDCAEHENELPKIYMTCGEQDALFPADETYRDHLIDLGYQVTWDQIPGGHDWDFWDTEILKVLEWLPLDPVNQAISSGHIEQE